jgi:plastin-1
VAWRRVTKPKPVPSSPSGTHFVQSNDPDEDEGPIPHAGLSRFKAVENTNYAVDLAKANKMHMVGIQGADIVDGRKTLVLGLVWQLMRYVYSRSLPVESLFISCL